MHAIGLDGLCGVTIIPEALLAAAASVMAAARSAFHSDLTFFLFRKVSLDSAMMMRDESGFIDANAMATMPHCCANQQYFGFSLFINQFMINSFAGDVLRFRVCEGFSSFVLRTADSDEFSA